MHSNISCTFLVAELKKLRVAASGGQDLSKELARTHQYTLQLERQLRFYLSRGSGEYPLDHFFLLRVCGWYYVCWSKLTLWYASTERAALPYQVSPLHTVQGYSGLGETPESLQATAGGAGQGQSFIPPPQHTHTLLPLHHDVSLCYPSFPPSCCVLPSQTRHLLSSEREDFHMRETRLEANLVATKKANQELEVLYITLTPGVASYWVQGYTRGY